MAEGEPITIMERVAPHPGTWNTRMMARGEPGVPMRFDWRGRTYVVAEILETRRETEPSSEGDDPETYVKRHAVRVRTESGEVMWLSGSRGTRARAPNWVLRHIEPGGAVTS